MGGRFALGALLCFDCLALALLLLSLLFGYRRSCVAQSDSPKPMVGAAKPAEKNSLRLLNGVCMLPLGGKRGVLGPETLIIARSRRAIGLGNDDDCCVP